MIQRTRYDRVKIIGHFEMKRLLLKNGQKEIKAYQMIEKTRINQDFRNAKRRPF